MLFYVKLRESRLQLSRTTGSLTIRALRMTDQGSYSCLVNSLAYPPISSSPALLTVLGNPENRFFVLEIYMFLA